MKPYSLRDILVYRKGAHKAVLMLYAYFDESGHYRDPNEKVVSIGGCLSTLEKWEIFEKEWDELLVTFRIECFHATDFNSNQKEFEDKEVWNEYRRRQFMQSALHIMDQTIDRYIGAAMPIDEWVALTPKQKAQCTNPYFMCFQDVIHSAGLEAIGYGQDEKVELVFSENTDKDIGGRKRKPFEIVNDPNEGMAYRCYKACKENLPIRDSLGPIVFDTPKNLLQLQAADLVAFELTKIGRKMLGPKIPFEKYRWPFKQILKKAPLFHFYEEGEVSRRYDWAK